MIIVPALYAASDDLMKKLNQFVKDGGHVRYYFNYSEKQQKATYLYKNGTELLSNKAVLQNSALDLEAWGVKIVEEN